MIEVTLYTATIADATSWTDDEAKFLKEQEKFVKAGFTPTVFEPGSKYRPFFEGSSSVILDKDRLAEFMVSGIRLEDVKPITTRVNIAEHLSKLAEKRVTLSVPAASNYNTKCEVHMPGQALSMYNDIRLLEDSCTDELQSAITEGWRIIAACPQPDQRRPDYILGRFDPRPECERSAKR